MSKNYTIFYVLAILIFVRCQNTKVNESLPVPNILWINVEDISPALGCSGDRNAYTPNLDKLAGEGILYTNAYSTAPICSPSRSSFITGVYSTSMGTQHLRSIVKRADFIKTLPEFLKEKGYFVTNYGKTDWNFSDEGVFDLREQSFDPWRKRKDEKPFFSMFVLGNTHEGSANKPEQYTKVLNDLPDSLRHIPSLDMIPPHYPKTDSFMDMWNRYYNLITRMDLQIGEIVQNLEADNLKDNTIIFFFSDHGYGMPRYKRFLYKTGIHIPLMIYVPEKYQHLVSQKMGTIDNHLVSLVDMVPSVLDMLQIEKPAYMQGQSFLGLDTPSPREYVFGERSRADDLFDMSRAVLNDEFIYIRNYMPHLPYMRTGVIMSDEKDSFRELNRLHRNNQLFDTMDRFYRPKPVEEFYDLKNDPDELNNLLNDKTYAPALEKLRSALTNWSLGSKDLGFIPEADYMIRSEPKSPYEFAQGLSEETWSSIIASANTVGTVDSKSILTNCKSTESAVRYWAVIAIQNIDKKTPEMLEALNVMLEDPSPNVSIAAAEVLCRIGQSQKGLSKLKKYVLDESPWVALQAARSVVEIGDHAKPLANDLLTAQKKYLAAPGAPRKYRDFEYSSFIGWALETALENCNVKPL